MSLTSELKKTDSVSTGIIAPFLPRLRELSARVNSSVRQAKVLPVDFAPHYPFMLVGTAVDYRLRFYFSVDSVSSMIIAEATWTLPGGFQALFDSFDVFLDAVVPVRNVLSDADEERLCRYCLILACVDHIGRGGSEGAMQFMQSIRRYGVKRKLAAVDDRMVADLVCLSRSFARTNNNLIQGFKSVVVGGTCAGSGDVGGADFDLLLGGCLFEVKTTTNPARYTLDALRQLLGYVLLDYDDAHAIQQVGIIFPRQDRVYRFDLAADIIGNDNDLAILRTAFRERLKAARGSGILSGANRE